MTTRELVLAAAKTSGIKAGYLGSHYSSTEALERFYAIANEDVRASRDAEIESLRQQLAECHKLLDESKPF